MVPTTFLFPRNFSPLVSSLHFIRLDLGKCKCWHHKKKYNNLVRLMLSCLTKKFTKEEKKIKRLRDFRYTRQPELLFTKLIDFIESKQPYE